jgi:L-alanine-DL-glutamate epimerase-like enolase superfamily enzyme
MKVTHVELKVSQRERSRTPVADALQVLDQSGEVEVVIRTDDGIEGRGSGSFGRVAGAPRALASIIENELKPLVMGTDPTFVRRTHAAMLRETEYHGSSGLTMFGIAAIDTALWDCVGKARGVPCWQLWGACRETVPAYAMVGWLNFSDDDVQKICARAVSQGFRGVKIKVGYPTLEQDLHRIDVVRAAIGPDVRMMVDANQVLTVSEALRRGRAFQERGIFWWEEPLPADDVDGYAALAAGLDIPVATGENLYTPAEFARFLRRDAVDIVQPDLRRGGGPTALLQIGMLADAFRRPYASHGGGPVQLSIMASLPNAFYLETGVVDAGSRLELVDGCAKLPRGAGFSWD